MVSGFLTSPNDHERICSGEAKPILSSSNTSLVGAVEEAE